MSHAKCVVVIFFLGGQLKIGHMDWTKSYRKYRLKCTLWIPALIKQATDYKESLYGYSEPNRKDLIQFMCQSFTYTPNQCSEPGGNRRLEVSLFQSIFSFIQQHLYLQSVNYRVWAHLVSTSLGGVESGFMLDINFQENHMGCSVNFTH